MALQLTYTSTLQQPHLQSQQQQAPLSVYLKLTTKVFKEFRVSKVHRAYRVFRGSRAFKESREH
jgi:hypothetical protein